MLEIHSNWLRICLLVVSILMILVFLAPVTVHIVNAGNLAGMAGGIVLLLFTLLNQPISRLLGRLWAAKAGKIAVSAVGIFLALGILLCVVLSVMMTAAICRTPDTPPQAMIVLGCKVRDGRPSLMLARRLQAAYDALETYPDMLCIVSGGKGTDEEISEAQCMYEWLTAKGVDASRILMENQSASTSENLRFSKKILDEHDIDGAVLIATDGYHEMRAQYLAKIEGLPETYAAAAATSLYLLPTYWVREWFGIVHAAVFGN